MQRTIPGNGGPRAGPCVKVLMDAGHARAIAAEAGTMMSSITYRFGSKRGLYLATARHVSTLLQT